MVYWANPAQKTSNKLLSIILTTNSHYYIDHELVSNIFYLHKLFLFHGQTDSSFGKCGVNLASHKKK